MKNQIHLENQIRLRRPPIPLLLAFTVSLVIPMWANITCGARLGVWWAPYPVWIFVALVWRLPEGLVLLVPSLAFAVTAAALARMTLRSARITAAIIALVALLVHIGWAANNSAEGIARLGIAYVAVVQLLGVLLLVIATTMICRSRREPTQSQVIVGVWLVFLWFAWLSVPWLFEAI